MDERFQLPFKQFVKGMFSEGDAPSSSRVLSFWLSVSSMGVIWFAIRHMMVLPADQLMIWVNGLPYIIASLAFFAVSPYGIAKAGQSFSDFLGRNKDKQ